MASTSALRAGRCKGLNGHDNLSATMTDYTIALNTDGHVATSGAARRQRHHHLGTAGFSYYYSRPLMAVTGDIDRPRRADAGDGTGVDGPPMGQLHLAVWRRLGLVQHPLADHTEYMLYVIRDAQKRPIRARRHGGLADGTVSEIPAAISIRAARHLDESTDQGRLSFWLAGDADPPGVALTLTPALRDQELVTANPPASPTGRAR